MSNTIDSILKETKERAKYFQTVHAWPLDEKMDYEGWLNNFKSDDEIRIACLLIDFFTYYPDNMVNQMLKSTIGQTGYLLSNKIKHWSHDDFTSRCYFSFIPGESQNPTDSGRLFLRKIRDELEIPEERLIEYSDIPETLFNAGRSSAVILVDDFVGSGAQCVKAWNINKLDYNNKNLREIAESNNHIFIYAPLIVNYTGYKRIINNCHNLSITPAHILGSEYNLFNSDCYCWKNKHDNFKEGVELILRKSKEIGIPFTSGVDTQDVKGFGEQGLALSFEHGTPDAVPAIFYWCQNGWTPLIKKTYER